ncbi:MAG TPA: RNA methyltransferase [Gemmatimonadaceae bacterium]|nr:RNA methyltransferase [Gemmatimonadaceae bacterium]
MTLARDLKRRKARERQGLFVAEGLRTVEALLASPLRVRGLLVSDTLERTPRGSELLATIAARGLDLVRVSEADFASAADTEQPQGVLAVAEQPERRLDALALADGARLLVLDGIQDPGNVGTLLRSAAALGAAASVVLPGTVDPWNAKVVRAAVGHQFRHPPIAANIDELRAFLAAQDCALWGASADGAPAGTAPTPRRLAIAVGNEGNGLSAELRDACHEMVSIPMAADAESLNVAVAAGILLHVLRPAN